MNNSFEYPFFMNEIMPYKFYLADNYKNSTGIIQDKKLVSL